MLYFLWSFLNFGLFIFFIVICFKATKLVRENLGIFAAIIFVIGLLSFISNSGNNGDSRSEAQEVKKWKFYPKDSITPNTSQYSSKIIDKNLIFKLDIGVSFGEESSTKKTVAIEANSIMTGVVSGYNWKPVMIAVQLTSTNNRFAYDVSGLLEWKLLGITLYSQSKSLSDTINLK